MEHTPREARLRPECANHYPTLPVSMWTGAAALANLVETQSTEERPNRSNHDRALVEADFEFRGGCCHRWMAGRAHTRIGEVV